MKETETKSGTQESTRAPGTNLERLMDYVVFDKNNEDIGKVSAIWSDHTGQPAFLGVKTSWLFGKTHVVPAYGVETNPRRGSIRLPYLKEDVKNAPNYDPDAELDMAKEREVFSYYRTKRPNLPEFGSTTPPAQQRSAQTSREAESAQIPLHEEQLKVGKREVEAGGIRLRKIIRTETVQQPVELRREDIVVERVPATEGQPTGRAFEGEDVYIPLRREEPIAEKETRVREAVRVSKTAETERQTVSEQVRREDIQTQREGAGASGRSQQQVGGARGREESQRGSKAVFGLTRTEDQASRIVGDLKSAGFSKDDISVLLSDRGGTKDFAHEKNTKAPEGAATGAGTGGVLGGALGWLAGVGALAIPGVGPFIAAGPLMATLSGAAVGAAAGGLTGVLVGMGMPEYEAKRYEGKLKEGNVLISVHSDNSEETRRAKDIFQRDGAEDISSAGEESVTARQTASR